MLRIKQEIETERGRRVSKEVRNEIPLEAYWNEDLQVAYEELKKALHKAAHKQLSCYDNQRKVCVYTDTSYDH